MKDAIEAEITFLRGQIKTLRRTARAIENQVDHLETRINDLRRVIGCGRKTVPRKHGVFRAGKVHVKRAMCATCIFRPGNLMDLRPGRVEQMVRDATRAESCIPCHDTLDGPQAVCRGFYDRHTTGPLQVAQRLGYIEWQK